MRSVVSEEPMSSFDDPFDPEIPLNREGCSCGHHKTQEQHDAAVAELQRRRQLQLQTVTASEESRYGRAVEGAVVRALRPRRSSSARAGDASFEASGNVRGTNCRSAHVRRHPQPLRRIPGRLRIILRPGDRDARRRCPASAAGLAGDGRSRSRREPADRHRRPARRGRRPNPAPPLRPSAADHAVKRIMLRCPVRKSANVNRR